MVFTDHKQKNLIWDVLCLTSNWKKITGWRTWARDCLYQRHTQYRCRSISRLGYDPSVNQTAESYFMTKVNKNSKSSQRQNWTVVSNIMVQTKSSHQQTWRLKSCVYKPQKRGWIIPFEDKKIPLKRDSKSTNISEIKIYCKNMQKHQKRICIFNLLKT